MKILYLLGIAALLTNGIVECVTGRSSKHGHVDVNNGHHDKHGANQNVGNPLNLHHDAGNSISINHVKEALQKFIAISKNEIRSGKDPKYSNLNDEEKFRETVAGELRNRLGKSAASDSKVPDVNEIKRIIGSNECKREVELLFEFMKTNAEIRKALAKINGEFENGHIGSTKPIAQQIQEIVTKNRLAENPKFQKSKIESMAFEELLKSHEQELRKLEKMKASLHEKVEIEKKHAEGNKRSKVKGLKHETGMNVISPQEVHLNPIKTTAQNMGIQTDGKSPSMGNKNSQKTRIHAISSPHQNEAGNSLSSNNQAPKSAKSRANSPRRSHKGQHIQSPTASSGGSPFGTKTPTLASPKHTIASHHLSNSPKIHQSPSHKEHGTGTQVAPQSPSSSPRIGSPSAVRNRPTGSKPVQNETKAAHLSNSHSLAPLSPKEPVLKEEDADAEQFLDQMAHYEVPLGHHLGDDVQESLKGRESLTENLENSNKGKIPKEFQPSRDNSEQLTGRSEVTVERTANSDKNVNVENSETVLTKPEMNMNELTSYESESSRTSQDTALEEENVGLDEVENGQNEVGPSGRMKHQRIRSIEPLYTASRHPNSSNIAGNYKKLKNKASQRNLLIKTGLDGNQNLERVNEGQIIGTQNIEISETSKTGNFNNFSPVQEDNNNTNSMPMEKSEAADDNVGIKANDFIASENIPKENINRVEHGHLHNETNDEIQITDHIPENLQTETTSSHDETRLDNANSIHEASEMPTGNGRIRKRWFEDEKQSNNEANVEAHIDMKILDADHESIHSEHIETPKANSEASSASLSSNNTEHFANADIDQLPMQSSEIATVRSRKQWSIPKTNSNGASLSSSDTTENFHAVLKEMVPIGGSMPPSPTASVASSTDRGNLESNGNEEVIENLGNENNSFEQVWMNIANNKGVIPVKRDNLLDDPVNEHDGDHGKEMATTGGSGLASPHGSSTVDEHNNDSNSSKIHEGMLLPENQNLIPLDNAPETTKHLDNIEKTISGSPNDTHMMVPDEGSVTGAYAAQKQNSDLKELEAIEQEQNN